jgi:HSP20 family protein
MYRRYSIPTNWREMDRLQREMNRLFSQYYSTDTYAAARLRPAPGYPALNVWSSESGLNVTAEVPGVRPEDIDISVVGETLTLSGTRTPDEVDENTRYHRQERGYGSFTRTLQLPFPIEVNNVEATFKNGILTIGLPRAEKDRPRKITVKSA